MERFAQAGRSASAEEDIPDDLRLYLQDFVVKLGGQQPFIDVNDPAFRLMATLMRDPEQELTFRQAAMRVEHLIDALDEYMIAQGWDPESYQMRKQPARRTVSAPIDTGRRRPDEAADTKKKTG